MAPDARALPLLFLLALAGCASPGTPPGGTEAPLAGLDADAAGLWGVVLDPVLRPVQGALVRAGGTDLDATTDGEGVFRLDGLPAAQRHVLVVSAQGFESRSVEVAFPHPASRPFVNVTLQHLPSEAPRVEVQQFRGFIQCDAIAQPAHSHSGDAHQHNNQRCDDTPLGSLSEHVWEFPVLPGSGGAMVEVVWEPEQDLARFLWVRLETTQEVPTILATQEAESPLRLQVSRSTMQEWMPDGGTLRLVALVGSGDEVGGNELGLGLQFQQEFEAFASIFYNDTPDPGYTVL